MVVTELAILNCKAGGLTNRVRDILKEAAAVQGRWIAQHLADSPTSSPERGTRMFQQVEDPSVVLLRAEWPSVASHYEWIRSQENKIIMDDLTPHIVTEGEKKVVLLHVEGDVLSSPTDPGSTLLSNGKVSSVSRLFVAPERRPAFEEKYSQASHLLRDFAGPSNHKTGWRVDKEEGSRDEFVQTTAWDSVERHMEFTKTADFPQYAELRNLVDEADVKHYRRFG